MDRAWGKVAGRGIQEIGAGADVVRGDVVGQVDDLGVRVDAEDHALHAADEDVGGAEVRQQGDDGRRDRFRAVRRPCHGRGYLSSKQMLRTSYSTTLAGVLTSTVSPTRLPMRARPTGD